MDEYVSRRRSGKKRRKQYTFRLELPPSIVKSYLNEKTMKRFKKAYGLKIALFPPISDTDPWIVVASARSKQQGRQAASAMVKRFNNIMKIIKDLSEAKM